ncbi:MAG TPA: hypothetical protein VG265_09505 [Gaiellaceae bacterium]|nr:hypothetical protein [Gaiellaceae bacterium]
MSGWPVLPRLGAALLAVAAGAGAVVIAVLLLRSVPGPVSSAAPIAPSAPAASPPSLVGGRIPTPTEPGYPSPPEGAVVVAREAGARALGLAIVPGSKEALVRVSVLSAAGPAASGLHVSIRLGAGSPVALPACGAGCYQAEVPAGSVRRSATVVIGSKPYPFALPPSLHLPDATAIVERAASVWKKLTSLVWHERLAANPTDALHTVYRAVAPDELSYSITGGSASIIIGNARWDRSTPNGRWVRSAQIPAIHEPLPFWVTDADARVLASARLDGQSVWVVSFFDPETPAWFTARIAKSTHRTLELTMTAVAHFMHHVYGPFDAPFHLDPPLR